MYKVMIGNISGFRKLFENDYRLQMAEPIFLLGDIGLFLNNKNAKTKLYMNLCRIIAKARQLKDDPKYHSFGMFLNDLYLQEFEFDDPDEHASDVDPEYLDYQVSLLHQFMYPSYSI